MTPDLMPEWVHTFAVWYTSASFVATMLVGVVPTPEEITWRPYVIAYATLQRLSLVRRKFNGNGK